MKFYLGTHRPNWLAQTDAPLFVSRRWLADRKTLPRAQGRWVLDSGGFTELNLYGEWRTTHDQYVNEVLRFEREIGNLDWVAPQDWMCEPFVLAKTGLTVEEHQTRTILSFEKLRYALGDTVIPVLQGWEPVDYLRHWQMYEQFCFSLENEPVVGLGSVCRRQGMTITGQIVRSLSFLNLHAFGAKLTGLRLFGDALTSADSMAWSYRARNDYPLWGCTHKNCSNCLRYALRWRKRVLESLDQLRLEEVA
jgi:hypothetical protein